MSDNDEIIVSVKGVGYGGWKAARITRSIETVCGSFEVELMDKWREDDGVCQIVPGDSCQVLLGGEAVITGYVDSVSPAISADDHNVTISGRDKTCDLVDCSAEVNSYEMIGQTLDGMARLLCGKFGIEVKVKTSCGAPFERFPIQPGETVFGCLERAAKQRGVLLTTDGDGALVLSARGDFAHSGAAIEEGNNLKSGTAVYDVKDRFRDYTCLAQMPAFNDGADDPVHDQIGKARDINVMRHRPLIVTAESWSTRPGTKTRAENECASRAGKSTRVNTQVVGWRHSGGSVWEPGKRASVTSPSLYLDNADLVVSTVRYSFSDSDGRIAELELTRPDAYLEGCGGQVEEDFDEL